MTDREQQAPVQPERRGAASTSGGRGRPEPLPVRVARVRESAAALLAAVDELLAACEQPGGGQGSAGRRLTATWVTTPEGYLTASLTADEVRGRLRGDADAPAAGRGRQPGPGLDLPVDAGADPAPLASGDEAAPERSK